MRHLGVLVTLLCFGAVVGQLPTVNIDKTMVSVSGTSSGGMMAVQYHLAYSRTTRGAGVLAGGPWYCAKNNVAVATTACMSAPHLINLPELYAYASNNALIGQIGPLSGLSGSPVWIYGTSLDETVKLGVTKKLETFYRHYKADVKTEYGVLAGHAWPTVSYGNPCRSARAPYVNACNFSATGALLAHVYGGVAPPAAAHPSSLRTFSQPPFIPSLFSGEQVGIADVGYVYAPRVCLVHGGDGQPCKLHVVFHGCSQTASMIGDVFVKHTEFLEYAEANRIVVVFPQTRANVLNEHACWDWWGYTGVMYPTNRGYQLGTIHNIVSALIS